MFHRLRNMLGSGRDTTQPVNSIAITLHINQEPGDESFLEAEFEFDGRRLEAFDYGPIDLVELIRSTQTDGTYFIWTCWCGSPGCGGNKLGVVVTTEDNCIRWNDQDLKRKYLINRNALLAAIESCKQEASRLLKGNLDLHWAPERNGEVVTRKDV